VTLSAPVLRGGELHDTISRRPVLGSRLSLDGMVFDVRVDTVDFGAAGTLDREYVEHPGAALIVALHPIDGVDHVCLIRQYRHPVGCYLWELPAGLLDVSAEPPWEAGRRELAEEVQLKAARWDVLIDNFASPGGFGEAVRIYLARELSDTPRPEGFVLHGEEVDLEVAWVSLDEAYLAVLQGRLHSPSAVIGIMAAYGSRALGWATLRPYDAPWPEHPGGRGGVR
jgi:ADP-ribose pyrophosphatase